MKWLSYQVFRLLGWRVEGNLPDVPKMVVVGAPHTSNWDFFLFLAALHHFDIKVTFLAKHTLFRWPFGFMFRKVGGLPVDRSQPGGVVRQVKAAFESQDSMVLVITPEGTRKAAPRWKSGFVEIAQGAGAPVVVVGVDGANKVLVVSRAYDVGPDRQEFMDEVREFLEGKDGIHPSGKGPVRIAGEVPSS